MSVAVSTIGFTKTSAEHFFKRLKGAGVEKLIDVRLNNRSQLAGFAKAADLKYFLADLAGIEYVHEPALAPTQEMLTSYRRGDWNWSIYQGEFLKLLASRRIEEKLTPLHINGACLLCSEATAHMCHRRLVCEYLNERWGNVLKVRHL